MAFAFAQGGQQLRVVEAVGGLRHRKVALAGDPERDARALRLAGERPIVGGEEAHRGRRRDAFAGGALRPRRLGGRGDRGLRRRAAGGSPFGDDGAAQRCLAGGFGQVAEDRRAQPSVVLRRQRQPQLDAALTQRDEMLAAARALAHEVAGVGVPAMPVAADLGAVGEFAGDPDVEQRVDLLHERLGVADAHELVRAQRAGRIGEQAAVLDVDVRQQRLQCQFVVAGDGELERPVLPQRERAVAPSRRASASCCSALSTASAPPSAYRAR